jgi:hypothetical protein
LSELPTTALGIIRGAGGFTDLYEAGTARERAYTRSIKIDKLGSAVVEELDKETVVDIDDLDVDEEGFIRVDDVVIYPKTQELFEWDLYN